MKRLPRTWKKKKIWMRRKAKDMVESLKGKPTVDERRRSGTAQVGVGRPAGSLKKYHRTKYVAAQSTEYGISLTSRLVTKAVLP